MGDSVSQWWRNVVNDREHFVAEGTKVSISNPDAELWNSHSFESRMIDIWATADDLLTCNGSLACTDEKLSSYADRMEALISMICSDDSRGKGFRETIREAQWEVFNQVFGDNSFGFSGKESMNWFDQFMYDINFDLV